MSTAPVVLVPRGGRWGERVSALVGACGGRGWVVPLIHTEFTGSAELARAQQQLHDGAFDWVAITSAAAVSALPTRVAARIAAVGAATARALHAAGHRVDHVPENYSAAGMLESWQPTGAVLVLHSDLAAPALTDGLRRGGATVTDVIAYRTLPTDIDPESTRQLQAGAADIALVTSGSIARALAQVHTGLPVACLGPRTAGEAQQAGLHVVLTARSRQIEALVADACHWYQRKSGEN